MDEYHEMHNTRWGSNSFEEEDEQEDQGLMSEDLTQEGFQLNESSEEDSPEIPESRDALESLGFATSSSSVINFLNTVVGGGLLSLPYALKASGLALGLFFLVLVYALSYYSLNLLLQGSLYARKRDVQGTRGNPESPLESYRKLATIAHGWIGSLVLSLTMILSCFGPMCSYFVIIADMLLPLIALATQRDPEEISHVARPVILTVTLVLMLPLASLKKLDSLRFTSFLGMASMSYVILAVVIRGCQLLAAGSLADCQSREGCFVLWKMELETASAIPIIAFAFTGHMNFFTIYSELKNPTPSRMKLVDLITLSISLIVYVLTALFGYFSFFDQTLGNILLNYALDDPVMNVARVALTIMIVLSFPMMSHPCVKTLDELLFTNRGKAFSYPRWVAEAITFSLLAWLVAVLVKDVSLIFSFVGATSITILAFILPSTCYVALHPNKKVIAKEKVLPYILFTFGVVLMATRTYTLFA